LLEEDPNALGNGMKEIFAQFQEMLPVEVEDQLAAEAEPEEFESSSDEEKQQEEEEEEDQEWGNEGQDWEWDETDNTKPCEEVKQACLR
jgi:hypothetical protein